MEESSNRLERLLALLLLQGMKNVPQSDKVHHLNLAGFTNVEIADLLQVNPQLVSDSLYRARRTGQSRRRLVGATRSRKRSRNSRG